MAFLSALWLPILVSAVIVFIASSIIHMVMPYHKTNYRQIPDEEKVTDAIRAASLSPGLYMFPYCVHKDMNSPAQQEKYKKGPVGIITMMPTGVPSMPKYLALWFGYCLLVGIFVAYLTWHTVTPGSQYLVVFRVAGTAAFLAFGVGNVHNGIWKGIPWNIVMKEIFDGLVYACLTAGTFGWLWPK